MSPHDGLLDKAAHTLTDDADRIVATPSHEVRARTIAAMEGALRAKQANKRLRSRIGRFALAASFVLAAMGGYQVWSRARRVEVRAPEVTATVRRLSGVASTWHNGQPASFEGKLANGDRVTTTADSTAEIALSTGTSVTLGPSADTTFTGVNKLQSFSLAAGKVAAHVAKLQEGERFLVRTADAEVEVRGTVFEVALVEPDPSCGGGTRTRVSVSEGVVVVRSQGLETRVAAGGKWPEGCTAVAVVSPPPPVIAPPPPKAVTAAPHPVPAAPSVDPLAAKNDLFASALAAKRRGELHVALAGFDSYLTKYPGGELVESASAQRMGILAKLDPARAVVAAKEYLAKWPNGFAREDAEAILNGP
jgi:hypothetical protein